MPAKQQVEVGGRSLALSNLDKVLYPGSSFTKAQVIDYHIRVARWLLPHSLTFRNLRKAGLHHRTNRPTIGHELSGA